MTTEELEAIRRLFADSTAAQVGERVARIEERQATVISDLASLKRGQAELLAKAHVPITCPAVGELERIRSEARENRENIERLSTFREQLRGGWKVIGAIGAVVGGLMMIAVDWVIRRYG